MTIHDGFKVKIKRGRGRGRGGRGGRRLSFSFLIYSFSNSLKRGERERKVKEDEKRVERPVGVAHSKWIRPFAKDPQGRKREFSDVLVWRDV
jgi:hypothetical protein